MCWFDRMRLSPGTGVDEWSTWIVDAGLPIVYSFAIHREGAEIEPSRVSAPIYYDKKLAPRPSTLVSSIEAKCFDATKQVFCGPSRMFFSNFASVRKCYRASPNS